MAYSIKGKRDLVLVEYSLQTFQSSRRVGRPGLKVFRKNAPCILYGANQHTLVGATHAHATPRTGFSSNLNSRAARRDARLILKLTQHAG
jgi:hypothetical protein